MPFPFGALAFTLISLRLFKELAHLFGTLVYLFGAITISILVSLLASLFGVHSRESRRTIVTGAQGPDGTTRATIANRLDIRDLIRNREQFSLYIQALAIMFAKPQDDPLSYFGICTIHGLPFKPWGGSGGTRRVQGSRWGGYCTHGTVLFPTWHRPYVALYEQVLQQHALAVAKQYRENQEVWLNAALSLRAPYWDWASSTVPPDEVISRPTVDIIAPDGNSVSVPNPLLQYTFNPVDPSFRPPYRYWRTTIRHPNELNNEEAITDAVGLSNDLALYQDELRERIHHIFSNIHTWPGFSNHSSPFTSLEHIHDDIHGTVGGHMGDPAVSAFDPIFFLHHSNTDRLLSLWAAVNPGVWVSSGPADEGTWTIPASENASVDANTDLTPFWESQTEYWTSSKLMATGNLGYSYPEFDGLDMGDTEAVRISISNYVDQQYGGGGPQPPGAGGAQEPGAGGAQEFDAGDAQEPDAGDAQEPGAGGTQEPDAGDAQEPGAGGAQEPGAGGARSLMPTQGITPVTQTESNVKSAGTAGTSIHPSHSRGRSPHTTQKPEHWKETQNVLKDWTARISFKKYELGEPFFVLIFLGNIPEDPSKWRTSRSLVGRQYAFVSSVASQCENCRNQADVVMGGSIPLNWAIAKRSGLSSYEPSVVVPYLKNNLNWRIQTGDRTRVIDPARLSSLEVTVVATPLTREPDTIFPIAGEPEFYHDITYGRPGGSRHAQEE